jgi:dolichol kinase
MTSSENTPSEPDFSEVVRKTEGLQPWRRVFHATNGTLVVLAVAVLGLKSSTAIIILAAVLAFSVILDVARLFDPKVNILFFRAFSSLASPREAKKIASSTWYALSLLLALLLFPQPYALAGILVLAWADPAASVVGQKWGKSPFLAGSVRGTATFVLVASLVEASPLDLDDNLIVPLTTAGILFLIGSWF